LRRDRDDVLRAHEAARVLAQPFEQALTFVLAVAVGLVEREQQRSLGPCEHCERIVLALGHVAIDDEHDEIADARYVVGEPLTRFAIELVDAGRVDQVHAAAGNLLPAALARFARRAVQHADRERILAEQRIRERGFADADAAEHRDVQFAAFEFAEHRLEPGELGGEAAADRCRNLRIVEQRAQAFGRLRAVRVVTACS